MAGHNAFWLYAVIAIFVLQIHSSICQTMETPMSTHNATATGSISPSPTESSSPWVYLYLQVTPEPPDPLGIANVSGVYGPGTWSAWFLTVCGSWVHSFSNSRWDVNTWAHLLYLNWASFDIIRHSRSLYLRAKSGSEDWTQEAGSIGAATTVLYWGIFHCICQVFCCILVKPGKVMAQRLLTLGIGMCFPAMSVSIMGILCMRSWQLDRYSERVLNFIPGVYYRGIEDSTHDAILSTVVAGELLITIGYGIAAIILFLCISTLVSKVNPQLAAKTSKLLETHGKTFKSVGWAYLVSGVIVAYTYFILSVFKSPHVSSILHILYSPIWGIGACVLLFAAWFMAYLLNLMMGIPIYIFKAYLARSVPISQSCFFMPCAPQKLSDWDQSGAFFVGISLFLGTDVMVPAIRYLLEQARQRRALRRDLDEANQRIELERVNRQNSGPAAEQSEITGRSDDGNDTPSIVV